MNPKINVIIHNVRSCHNVGAILRTADAMSVDHVYLTGYTPYPIAKNDDRLPHIANKAHKLIQKTALGAEESVNWSHRSDVFILLSELKTHSKIIAIEQDKTSQPLNSISLREDISLIVGREVEGLELEVIKACDMVAEIPMLGKKESLNVTHACALALYHFRFITPMIA